jgi:hypothetical protein
VLTVTTDHKRMQAMIGALRSIARPHGPGAALFFFATHGRITTATPLTAQWNDGNERPVTLI